MSDCKHEEIYYVRVSRQPTWYYCQKCGKNFTHEEYEEIKGWTYLKRKDVRDN